MAREIPVARTPFRALTIEEFQSIGQDEGDRETFTDFVCDLQALVVDGLGSPYLRATDTSDDLRETVYQSEPPESATFAALRDKWKANREGSLLLHTELESVGPGTLDVARARAEAFLQPLLLEYRALRGYERIVPVLDALDGVRTALDEGRLSDARRGFESALGRTKVARHEKPVGAILGGLGWLHEQEGDFGEARRLHERALRMDQRLGILEGMAAHLLNLGRLHRDLGEDAHGDRHLQRAARMFERLGDQEQADEARRLQSSHDPLEEPGGELELE